MLECELPLPFTVIPATADEACFVFGLYAQNRTALHAGSITLSEWRELLACGDADEAHFLICKGAMPAAYMKLNGLLNTDTAYLSMLFVAKRHQREGIGRFAVGYAERFLAARGFAAVGVQTTADNLPAQALYKACGYSDVPSTEAERRRFVKRLNEDSPNADALTAAAAASRRVYPLLRPGVPRGIRAVRPIRRLPFDLTTAPRRTVCFAPTNAARRTPVKQAVRPFS